jgi:ABC-type lipoprotein release transport system permease subunit
MLKALGATPLSISFLFLGQSLVVGVLGVASGLGFGMLLLRFRNEFLRFMNDVVRVQPLSLHRLPVPRAAAQIAGSDVLIICGSVARDLCAGGSAAGDPGRLAADPWEALRHE